MNTGTGTIKFYNDSRGFGFIKREGDRDLFFHISGVESGYQPQKDDSVEFEVGKSAKGPAAKNVRPASADAGEVTMEVEMGGGAVTSSGSCNIVCGLQGEPLPALSAPTRGTGKGSYATFRVGKHIQVHGTWHRGEPTRIIVVEVTPVEDGKPTRELLWEGIAAELPEVYDHLEKAVRAADEKAQCYHCHELHFPVANVEQLGAWV